MLLQNFNKVGRKLTKYSINLFFPQQKMRRVKDWKLQIDNSKSVN